MKKYKTVCLVLLCLLLGNSKLKKNTKFMGNAWVYHQEEIENTKLYNVLNVDKNATLDEIKKAYRTLSKTYHPDKSTEHGADKKFNEIVEAYEILSDSEKRRIYDTRGLEAVRNMDQQKGENPADHYNSFFEEFFGGGGSARRGDEVRKADNLVLTIDMNLEQLYKGELFSVQYTREINCLRIDECIERNSDCSGRGYKTIIQQMAPGFIMQNKVRDETCIDKGKAWRHKCPYCPSGMKEKKTIKLTLEIEKGTKNNEKIVFEKKGRQEVGYENGDLIFIVQTKAHKIYERKNNDLHQSVSISLKDALIGFDKNIEHIGGSPVNVNKQTVTFHNEVLKIKNKGMPIKNSNKFGDLYIKFSVKFPKKLTEKQKKMIAEVL